MPPKLKPNNPQRAVFPRERLVVAQETPVRCNYAAFIIFIHFQVVVSKHRRNVNMLVRPLAFFMQDLALMYTGFGTHIQLQSISEGVGARKASSVVCGSSSSCHVLRRYAAGLWRRKQLDALIQDITRIVHELPSRLAEARSE